MSNNDLLTVGEFAELSRVAQSTLHHYDRIGLLSPTARGANRYRFYSINQLAICNTIRILHELGLPLAKIRELLDRRTPELTETLLVQQIAEFGKAQEHLGQTQTLLYTILKMIRSGLGADVDAITIQYLPAENIILGELNDYSDGKSDYEALYEFYQNIMNKHALSSVDVCFPVWGMFSHERVISGDVRHPDRYYFYNPRGKDQRPAGLYAIGHTRAGYGGGTVLYQQLLEYIDQNGFEICGDAYEEYPLNEVGVTDNTNYLLRVMIAVREKDHSQ